MLSEETVYSDVNISLLITAFASQTDFVTAILL